MFNENPTDAGNARWFRNVFGDQVRFVPERGRWIFNVGTHWRDDVDGEIERLAKKAVSGIFKDIHDLSTKDRRARFQHGLRSEQAPRIAAALSLLKSEEGITISQSALDTNPYLLGVYNGVVDLRTGELRQPRTREYVTRQAGCDFASFAECPTWLAFLARVLDHDGALINFMQRAIGYSLTPDTREQCLFILHGPGSNGKSVFLRTLRDLLGDYGTDACADTFLDRRNGSASNDLARLAGARYVVASEIDEGKRFAEALVKAVTGGEALSARFLYREHFSFLPTFKLWLGVNHKPAITGDDNGIWRRVRLVPFRVTIPPAEQDRDLVAKLRLELPGILNWALEGCRAWQEDGLQSPLAVTQATDAYRAESDAIGEWIHERCIEAEGASTQATPLYNDYATFIEDRRGRSLSMKRWAQRMADRGFQRDEGRVVHYRGIALCDLRDLRDDIPQTSPYPRTRGQLYEKGRNGRNGRKVSAYEEATRGD